MRLIDRGAEKQALNEVLEGVRRGMSGVLVLRGEPGVGKSALLDYVVDQAPDMQVVRTMAVEAERDLGYAAVHQLLVPFLPGVDGLPEPQRQALKVAFGLVSGHAADPFLVGLGVLTLLSDAAEARPVLCVIDDAQWLDDESADLLCFTARRLLADRVGLLFGVRESVDAGTRLQVLPSRRVEGLPEQAALELLTSSISQPVDPLLATRIVVETAGNPLAVLEVARGLTPDQLEGRESLPEPLPVGHRLEAWYLRRVSDVPSATRTLLVLAAAGTPGQADVMWRAAAGLGISESAAAPAEASGLVVFWPEVRFVHPLARSAVYHAATGTERRLAHRALASATDPELDVVSRAWHLAAAAARRDEGVAAELEKASDLARSRGGYAGTARLLERAAQLTPARDARGARQLAAVQAHLLAGNVNRADALLVEAVPGLRGALAVAEATRLRGRIEASCGRVSDAVMHLVDAAGQLRTVDPPAARDALLSALESAAFAGWGSSAAVLEKAAPVAGGVAVSEGPSGAAPDLLLFGYTARLTGGYAAGAAAMRRAIEAFLNDDLDADIALRRLELAAISAVDLLDDAAVERLTARWICLARERGALARLAGGLAFRSAFVDAAAGRLAAALTADAEARELGTVTHNPAVVPPTGAHRLITLALSGSEAEARQTAAVVAREAPTRGAQGEAALASHALGVLELSLGNYAAAVACLQPAFDDDTPLIGTVALPDLVEAAVRAGQQDLAECALSRLRERAEASGTPLAGGLLARSQALFTGPEGAEPKYQAALALLDRTAAVPQLARGHLLYGEWLRRQRRRREARDELHLALDLFEGSGLEGFAERTRMELRATGERLRRREVGVAEELTPQEAQITALVSRGATNREIASQLFVSPSTVEYHLRKVFRKVGVNSRTQLAHHMINHAYASRT